MIVRGSSRASTEGGETPGWQRHSVRPPPRPLLLFFDIDGTLTSGGPAKAAFHAALDATFGTVGPIAGHDYSGKTDPLILRELLTAPGQVGPEVEAAIPVFRKRYVSELEARIRDEPVTALPGVRRLIAALAARTDVFLALVTGNVREGARLKLLSAGMWQHFPVGAFGCDHEARNELPPIALERARAHWGRDFRAEDTVVVGDTPRDVECARSIGAATVAVTTGRFSAAELERAGAERVLSGFADLRGSLAALLQASPGVRPR